MRLDEPRCNGTESGKIIFAETSHHLPLGDLGATIPFWAPLVPESKQRGLWIVGLMSVWIGDKRLHECQASSSAAGNSSCLAAFDSGSSFMMGPRVSISAALRELSGENQDCESSSNLPPIRYELLGEAGVFSVTILPEDYLDVTNGRCQIALTPLDLPDGIEAVWVLGQPLLRKYVTVYDFPGSRVGLAARSESTTRGTGISLSAKRTYRVVGHHRQSAGKMNQVLLQAAALMNPLDVSLL